MKFYEFFVFIIPSDQPVCFLRSLLCFEEFLPRLASKSASAGEFQTQNPCQPRLFECAQHSGQEFLCFIKFTLELHYFCKSERGCCFKGRIRGPDWKLRVLFAYSSACLIANCDSAIVDAERRTGLIWLDLSHPVDVRSTHQRFLFLSVFVLPVCIWRICHGSK